MTPLTCQGMSRLARRERRGQARTSGRCPYHRQVSFTRWGPAAGMAARVGGDHPYWCPYAGAWHVTSLLPGEYDRLRAGVVPA